MDNWVLIPQEQIGNETSEYDLSIVSYIDGDVSQPLVGRKALTEEKFIIKNIKQVMKLSSTFTSIPSNWQKGDSNNFVYNKELDLDQFKPDLPSVAFKHLIKALVVERINKFATQLDNKSFELSKVDLLIGEPVFPNEERLTKKQFKESYRANIRRIFKKLKFNNKISFFYEPFAIIRYAIYNKYLEFNKQLNTILILDFGGSTFNCCITRTTNIGTIPEGNKYKNVFGSNLRTWGCSRIDFEILKLIKSKYAKLFDSRSLFSNKDHHHAELLKIKISNDIKSGNFGPWHFNLDNSSDDFVIASEDFRSIIVNKIWPDIKSTILKTIEEAGIELDSIIDKIDFVVFAGGGSNLPFLKDLFKESFPHLIENENNLITINRPELAVSEGLAIEAMMRIENKSEMLSDDEYLDSDLFMTISEKGNILKSKIKIRLIPGATFNENGKIIDCDLIKKEDLILNTIADNKKPWEITFANKLSNQKYEYIIYNKDSFSGDAQLERAKFEFSQKPEFNVKEMDMFLEVKDNGQALPIFKRNDGEIAKVQKPFDLWSFTPQNNEMIAIDLGNSTTSLYFVSPNLSSYNFMNNDNITNSYDQNNGEKKNTPYPANLHDFNTGNLEDLIQEEYKRSKLFLDILERKFSVIIESKPSYISLNAITSDSIHIWLKKWQGAGFFYDYDLVAQIIVTFQSNKMPVLYGPPGIGKSKLIELLSKELCSEFFLIPVKPNWRDDSYLINSNDKITEFQEAVYFAWWLSNYHHQDRPVIVCLDEMNLSHPEYYMAELLSKMEYDFFDDLRSIKIKDKTVPLLSNLLISGTLNIDHTTKILSPKLRSRVKFINIAQHEIKIIDKLCYGLDQSIIDDPLFVAFSNFLISLNNIFKVADLGLSYRTIQFINDTLKKQFSLNILSGSHLYDYLLMTSIIPMIEFNRLNIRHENVVEGLTVLSNSKDFSISFPKFSIALKKIIEEYNNSAMVSGLI